MKLTISKILFIGIILQIFAIQGVLMFNIFDFFGYWELKSALHPIGVCICLIYVLLKVVNKGSKLTLSYIEIVFFTYLFISSIILVFNAESLFSAFIALREVVLVFFLITIFSRVQLSFKEWRIILKILYLLIILNILFTILTYTLGAEQYMKLVTGRFIWPTDPEYKFKISNFHSFWRSPALIGSSAAVGYFGLLTYFLFLEDDKYKAKVIFPLILVVLSFTRSVYLVLIIFLFIKFLLKKRNLKKLEIILPYSIPILLLLCIPMYKYNLFSFHSIIMRIEHWLNDIDVNYNWFYGGAFGNVGGAVRGGGFVSILDSYWLLVLTSLGLVGVILIILFMYEKAKNIQMKKVILIAFFFGCFFVTITQSISFIVLFPLIFLNKRFAHESKYVE